MDTDRANQVFNIARRIAIDWKDCVLLEMRDELTNLPLRQRALAIQFIYERCYRYSHHKVKKELDKPSVQDEIDKNDGRPIEFVLLHRYMQTGKYLERVIRQTRQLIPFWQEDKFFNLRDLYEELFPRKPSIGEHEDCSGEVIISGSYYRCRKCKSVGHEIRETLDGNLVLLSVK